MKILNIFKKKEKINNFKDIYLDKLADGDFIKIRLFNREKLVTIVSTGKNRFDEKGNYKKDHFELSNEEVECLKWFVENVDISNYTKEIIEYCNEQYSYYSDIKITEKDIENEINITTITIRLGMLERSKDRFIYPEISFYGDCKCDEEHGICIGFRDKKLIGINSQDWSL